MYNDSSYRNNGIMTGGILDCRHEEVETENVFCIVCGSPMESENDLSYTSKEYDCPCCVSCFEYEVAQETSLFEMPESALKTAI